MYRVSSEKWNELTELLDDLDVKVKVKGESEFDSFFEKLVIKGGYLLFWAVRKWHFFVPFFIFLLLESLSTLLFTIPLWATSTISIASIVLLVPLYFLDIAVPKIDFGDFVTTVDKNIWFYESGYEPRSYSAYKLIRHELIHVIDSMRFPIVYEITYALVLPFLFTVRSFWEVRGYTQNILVWYEEKFRITEEEVESKIEGVSRFFISPSYLFMAPFPFIIKPYFRSVYEKIESEEISGYYPYWPEISDNPEKIVERLTND